MTAKKSMVDNFSHMAIVHNSCGQFFGPETKIKTRIVNKKFGAQKISQKHKKINYLILEANKNLF